MCNEQFSKGGAALAAGGFCSFPQLRADCYIYSTTETIARCAGDLRGQFSLRGIVRSQADMLIAATAQVHQLTLVTRNIRDFEGCGIGLLNPFSTEGS